MTKTTIPPEVIARKDLSPTEARNVATMAAFADAWNESPDKMIGTFYADKPEVFMALQNIFVSRSGAPKDNFVAVEQAIHKLYRNRSVEFKKVVPAGDVVACEVVATLTDLGGNVQKVGAATFFQFDADGRIASDHTYMFRPEPEPEKAKDPTVRQYLQDVVDARARIDAAQ